MKLRRDLMVEFDSENLTVMIVNAIAGITQEFLGTGQQDIFNNRVGTMTSPDWKELRYIVGEYVDFVYTGEIRTAIIVVSPEAVEGRGDDPRHRRFAVLVDITNEDRRVVAVYEDVPADSVFLEFDQEKLDFVVPPRS